MTLPVSAAIVTYRPNIDHLSRTLDSLHRQTHPPAEIILVDSTPEGPPLNRAPIRSYQPIMASVAQLQSDGVDVVTTQAGIGRQRRAGIETATQPFITHLDEDAVLTNPNHVQIALERLEDPDVAAVGGPVDPIDPSPLSTIISRVERGMKYVRCTHYLTHERQLCDGEALTACFPNEDRGNDIYLRRHLQSHGRVVRDDRLVALKDLPTTRQKRVLRNVSLAGAGIALAR